MALKHKSSSTKKYANKLTKIKIFSKKLYLKNEIINPRNDMKKFWSIIKTSNPQNSNNKAPDRINLDENIVDNALDISQHFNDHFCSCGKKLSDSICNVNEPKFSSYLVHRVLPSMYFQPASILETFNHIHQLIRS